MGGYNSSRWHWHTRKLTVEECSKLKVADFPKSLLSQRCEAGALVYSDESYPAIYARLLVDAALGEMFPDRPTKSGQSTKADRPHGQPFHIQRTACNYGNWRYWLLCPDCRRRCGVLYKHSYPGHYACRKCHNLTYISTQDARKPVGYGALAMYLTRSRMIERKLEKVKRWRKRARKLDAQLDRLHARLGGAWRGFGSPDLPDDLLSCGNPMKG